MSLFSIKIVLFVFALISAAVFAFLETAFTTVRLFTVKNFSQTTTRYKKLFDVWEHTPARLLITILIASNLADVACSILIADITQSFLGDTGMALALGVVAATACILFFGEIIPKSYAKVRHDRLFGSYVWLINALFYMFHPLVSFLLACTDLFVSKIEGSSVREKHDAVSEHEIQFLIDYGDKKGLIESDKSEMLQNVFSLGQTTVKEILVPTNEMITLDVSASFEAAMKCFSLSRFSRVPVYEKREDNIIGMIYQKDLFGVLYRKENKTLRDIVMPILFEPETKKINQLLSEFLKKQIHMAIVIDEFGKMAGLVTLEDILEEIVGEIVDEREQVPREIISLEDGKWVVDGRIELEKLENILGIAFTPSSSITLGGFLTENLQHLPKKGESISYKDFHFNVQRTTSRRVQQVLVIKENLSSEKQIN